MDTKALTFKPLALILAGISFNAPALADDMYADAASILYPGGAERSYSQSAEQVKAPYAFSIGATGKNVVVGIVDTGLSLGTRELRGRVLSGWNAVTGSSDVTDSLGHGTHVSGIVGAAVDGRGMYGIAPESYILPVKVFATTATPMKTSYLPAFATRSAGRPSST